MVGRPVHPWDTWIDFEPHRIVQGTDFSCSVQSMRGQLTEKANWLALEVVLWHRSPGVLWFMFIDSRGDDLPDEWYNRPGGGERSRLG
jgi:hypothetical protein